MAASGGVDGGHMAWCAEGHVRVRVRVPCAVCVCVCRVRVHVYAAAVVAAAAARQSFLSMAAIHSSRRSSRSDRAVDACVLTPTSLRRKKERG